MYRNIFLILLACTSLSLAQATNVASSASGTTVQIPAFSFPDLDGKTHASTELQGHYVLLDFWATWCITCRNVVRSTKELRTQLPENSLTVIGVSIDKGNPDKVRSFAKKMGMDWLLLLDPDNTLAPQLGFEAIPSVFFFSPEGKLIASMKGYDPDQEKAFMAKVEETVKNALKAPARSAVP